MEKEKGGRGGKVELDIGSMVRLQVLSFRPREYKFWDFVDLKV